MWWIMVTPIQADDDSEEFTYFQHNSLFFSYATKIQRIIYSVQIILCKKFLADKNEGYFL